MQTYYTAVRETDDSRHQGDPIQDLPPLKSLEPSQHSIVLEGFREALNWASMMPREASLCKFYNSIFPIKMTQFLASDRNHSQMTHFRRFFDEDSGSHLCQKSYPWKCVIWLRARWLLVMVFFFWWHFFVFFLELFCFVFFCEGTFLFSFFDGKKIIE